MKLNVVYTDFNTKCNTGDSDSLSVADNSVSEFHPDETTVCILSKVPNILQNHSDEHITCKIKIIMEKGT